MDKRVFSLKRLFQTPILLSESLTWSETLAVEQLTAKEPIPSLGRKSPGQEIVKSGSVLHTLPQKNRYIAITRQQGGKNSHRNVSFYIVVLIIEYIFVANFFLSKSKARFLHPFLYSS